MKVGEALKGRLVAITLATIAARFLLVGEYRILAVLADVNI